MVLLVMNRQYQLSNKLLRELSLAFYGLKISFYCMGLNIVTQLVWTLEAPQIWTG